MALARVATPIQGLDPHLSHQPRDALATVFVTFTPQHVAQHPGTGERVPQMQLIPCAASSSDLTPASVRDGNRRKTWTAGGSATGASPASRGRPRSSLCARIADATERAGQKIILQRQLTDLGMQRLQIRFTLALLRNAGKYVRGPFQQLAVPLRDLIRMHIQLLRQRRKGLITLEGGNRHLRLERDRVVSTGTSHALCSFGLHKPIVAETSLIPVSGFPGPALLPHRWTPKTGH